MSFLARIAAFFRPRTSRRNHVASSRNQLTLADARLKQQSAVQKMRRGVADVSVSRQRLDHQVADLHQAMDALARQADESQSAGDGAGAQAALNRHLVMGEQLADLTSQRDALADQETMLIAALTQLRARVSGFNVTVETLNAAHTAADANHAIAQALDDLDDNHRQP